MKYLDEYRDGAAARKLADTIAREVTRPWAIMEVCGGQTHTLVKYGIEELLPPGIELLHGPGCPVCVTSLETIDRAHTIASRPDVIFCSFGDMLRVPGSRGDLLALKSQGSDVRVVYSPLDALNLAAANPGRRVVFFAIGVRDDGPRERNGRLARAPPRDREFQPARVARARAPGDHIHPRFARQPRASLPRTGSRLRDHGTGKYEPIARRYRVPIVISGFEPVDMLEGILLTVRQLEAGRAEVENQYTRAVRPEGNPASRKLIDEVFEVCDRKWRGIGAIGASGWQLRREYHAYDAARIFDATSIEAQESIARRSR